MRVVSWNIELGRDIAGAERDLTTIETLRDADILLLQEMSEGGTQDLANRLGVASHYLAPATHPETGQPFGNAILSRWPMSPADGLLLPHTARVQGQPRSATSAVVTVDGTTVTAFSVHIETVLLGLRQRTEQVATLGTAIQRDNGGRLLVGGDFNTASQRSTRRFDAALDGAGMRRVTPPHGPTFHRFGRPFTLDHIYARGLSVTDSGVAAEARASDHLPVWAVFEMPPEF